MDQKKNSKSFDYKIANVDIEILKTEGLYRDRTADSESAFISDE